MYQLTVPATTIKIQKKRGSDQDSNPRPAKAAKASSGASAVDADEKKPDKQDYVQIGECTEGCGAQYYLIPQDKIYKGQVVDWEDLNEDQYVDYHVSHIVDKLCRYAQMRNDVRVMADALGDDCCLFGGDDLENLGKKYGHQRLLEVYLSCQRMFGTGKLGNFDPEDYFDDSAFSEDDYSDKGLEARWGWSNDLVQKGWLHKLFGDYHHDYLPALHKIGARVVAQVYVNFT